MEGKSTLEQLYAAIHRAENKVGGGEGLVGIYGSMTQQGTENIMRAMAQLAGLDPGSILVDIGSGLCRPLLHATVQYGVHRTFGVELDAVKCQKAVPFVQHAASQLECAGVKLRREVLPTIICASVEQLGSLDPATHAYAAWEGFPVQAKMAVGDLFAATPSLRTITIVQRSLRNEDPAEAMADLGFGPVTLLSPAIPVHMSGSHRRLNAYIFTKISQPTTGVSRGIMQGNGAVKNQRAAVGGTCVWQGGSSQAARPSLSTAMPFDPAAVMEALARMDGSAELATTTATGWATGRRSSNRSAAALSAVDEDGRKSTQGMPGPGGSQPLHGHGLRSNRKRSARALQLDVETNNGDDEGHCVGGSGSGEWMHMEEMSGRAQPEGRQSMPSTGLKSNPLVIMTRRRSQRASSAHRGSVASETTAAAAAAAAAGEASGDTVGAQQGPKMRLPWQPQQKDTAPEVTIGAGLHASPPAPLSHQTRAAACQAEQNAALRLHSMPGRQHSTPWGQHGMPGGQHSMPGSVGEQGEPSAHAEWHGSHGTSMQTRLRCTTGDAGCGVGEGLGMQTRAKDAAEEVKGGAAGGVCDGVSVGNGVQTRARVAAGNVSDGASDEKSVQMRASGAAGGVCDHASVGQGVQTRARSAAGTAAATSSAAVVQPLELRAWSPTAHAAQVPLLATRRETKPKAGADMEPMDLEARGPAVRAAQLPLFVMRREMKPRARSAQPEMSAKRAHEAPASNGHAAVEKAKEPAAKLRRVAGPNMEVEHLL